ncbi:ATP-dependent DNA helicase [Caligus rogercresseyi]|uniref:ATP-dependent DNA helicase n=1 Tax=Caligus rogercresseyi TaxID=217165 RepID=A0A7T8JW61_CALRO|nr:ATP-dependent DNA helicase [Caligus rogercresseyi]QQP49390.1 ATP-dependent DNA helicase [Caligus rogercresseyi]
MTFNCFEMLKRGGTADMMKQKTKMECLTLVWMDSVNSTKSLCLLHSLEPWNWLTIFSSLEFLLPLLPCVIPWNVAEKKRFSKVITFT